MRYLKLKTRTYFLNPSEGFETDSSYTMVNPDTSVRRYVFAKHRRMKFLKPKMSEKVIRLWSLTHGFTRSNFLKEHYDDQRFQSSRKFWFFRDPKSNPYTYDPDVIWDLGSKRKNVKRCWK